MDELNNRIEGLLEAIHGSEEYRVYRREEENLKADPELLRRVDAFRANNFRLQKEADESSLLEVTDRLNRESAQLRRIPQVNAYLDAELALCRMLQNICRRLAEGIEMHFPEL